MAKPKLGSGGRFATLSGGVKKEYEKKGMSSKRAGAIAGAVAANAGRAKYGKEKFQKLGARGR